MKDVNMDEPLPETKLEDRKVRAAYLLTGINGESVRMTLSHLAQVLAALTGEQLGAVVGALPSATRIRMLGPAAGALAKFDCERADQEKARADRAVALARAGWESARLLAICPPTFGAPATERAADEALAQIKELETKNG